MKHFVAWLVLALLSATTTAQDIKPAGDAEPPAPEVLKPLHQGYAFDQTEVLVRQRLFGLAHGLSLLAGACLDVPEQSGATQEAYAAWHAKQAEVIDVLVHDLSAYYFGARADEAHWADLVRALKLKDNIRDVLGEVVLEDACATLPTAIIRPRYELDRLLAEGKQAELDDPATGAEPKVAVPPAPTSAPDNSTTPPKAGE